MTIQYIRPLPGREGNYGKTIEHTAVREWLCCSDSRYETDYSITQYGWSHGILPIPYVTSIFGLSPLIPLLCRKLAIKQDKKSPLHYVITADHSSEPISQQEKNQQASPNPLDRPSAYKWKTNKYNKATHKDKNGKAIVNSAGEFFDPPPESDLFRWTVTVTTNVAGIPNFMLEFAEGGPTNSSPFTIQGVSVGEQVARISDMDISDLQSATLDDGEGGTFVQEYFVFSYSMEFHRETWALKLLDQGMRQIDPDDETKRIAIKDDAVPPKEVKKPWPLDGEGARLDDPSPENAVELSFDITEAADFSVLPGLIVFSGFGGSFAAGVTGDGSEYPGDDPFI